MLDRFPLIPNDEPNILQIGKLYLSNFDNTKTIQEFCGWEATTLYFREWRAGPSKCPAVGDTISLVAEPQQWTKRIDTFCHTLIAHVYACGRVNKKGIVTSTKIWAIQPDSIPVRIPPVALLPPPRALPPASFQSPYRLFTDGAHRKLLSVQQIIFGILPCDLSSQSVLNSSGGVIYKDRYPFQLITVTGFDRQVIPNSSSYESEAIGLLAGLSALGERALQATAYTDSKALLGKLRQYRIKVTAEYSADPLITRLHCIVSQFHVNLQWVKGHPERRAKHKRKDWTEQDIGIYIADQMTFGEVNDLAPLRFNCDNIEPTVIYFRDLIPSLHCTRYQYRREDNVPLADYQMRLLHQQKIAEEYLLQREHASSTNAKNRNIRWTQLSLPLSVQALEYNRYISKTRVAKTIFDLYDDDLHKTGNYVQLCSLCRTCADTTEHLYSCCDPTANSIVQFALIEQQKIPVPQELYERVTIAKDHITAFRQLLVRIINLDAQTRIGLFNREQQETIVNMIPGRYGRNDSKELFGVISKYIVRLLQPTISATLGLIVLRNNKKKEFERINLQRDEAKVVLERKRRVYESPNPFSLLFPSDSTYVLPTPVASYEICYGYPSVTAQIVARTSKEAVGIIAQLVQTPVDSIDFYHSSSEQSGAFVLSTDISPHTMNFISRKDSIFSPLQLFPRSDDPDLADVSRYRAIQEPHLSNSDSIVYAKFLVRLERIFAMKQHSRFSSFLQQCSHHLNAAHNKDALYDIQTDIYTLQASTIHKNWLTCEQLHLFLMWSPDARNLRRVFQYAVSVEIDCNLDNCQQHSADNLDLPLLRMLSDQIVVYRYTTSEAVSRRLPRLCKKERIFRQKQTKNTFDQCLTFHKDGRHVPKISSFPTISTATSTSSPPETLDSLQSEVKTLFLRYATVAGQKLDIRDMEMCQQIISDTEILLTDERMSCLSAIHRRYLRGRLRRAITQTQSILQESASYDPPSKTAGPGPLTVSSILPFLIHRRRLDNKDPPD
jgi:ribonuclease HI